MANPWKGEAALTVNGETLDLRLTLGALAELESALKADSLVALAGRFESGAISARDVLAVLVAGLRGGGHRVAPEALASAEISGGPLEAARVASLLVVRAFSLPDATA